jgi:sulfate transporter 4
MDEDDSYSSTVGLLAVASGSPDSLRKRPMVSSHRRALEFIRTDALANRRHAVPHMQFDLQTEHRSLRRWIGDLFSSGRKKSISEWCEAVTPIVSWLKSYDFRSNFITDLVAGLTVGIMIIPQSMSYAKLAGLPVEYGLYSAVFPIYSYACFGSSRQLAVGPVAIISLLLSSGLSSLLEGFPNLSPGTPEYQATYNQMAVQISFLVGITYIVLGICRMGFITNFLSHAVISGFSTGAAVIIGMSQVRYLLGYDVERSDRFHVLIFNMLRNIDNFNWRTFLFGLVSICFLLFAKTASAKSPRFQKLRAVSPLIVTVTAIILTFAFGLENKGIPVVGQVPGGLPTFTISYWTPVKEASKIIPIVSSITLVGFMESIAIAKRLASKHKYEIDSSQELIGLGMSVRDVTELRASVATRMC